MASTIIVLGEAWCMCRARQERRAVTATTRMLGVSEAKLEELDRRDEERVKIRSTHPIHWSKKRREEEAARRAEEGKEMGTLDEERMKLILTSARLGTRAEEVRKKERKLEIVEGSEEKAVELREEIRVIEVFIERFQALGSEMESVDESNVWQC